MANKRDEFKPGDRVKLSTTGEERLVHGRRGIQRGELGVVDRIGQTGLIYVRRDGQTCAARALSAFHPDFWQPHHEDSSRG